MQHRHGEYVFRVTLDEIPTVRLEECIDDRARWIIHFDQSRYASRHRIGIGDVTVSAVPDQPAAEPANLSDVVSKFGPLSTVGILGCAARGNHIADRSVAGEFRFKTVEHRCFLSEACPPCRQKLNVPSAPFPLLDLRREGLRRRITEGNRIYEG